MLSNILITLALLVLSFLGLQRVFNLPKNVWLLFLTQPLVMAASPVIVFIGGILATSMGANAELVTLPVTMMILGVASTAIPAALLAKKKGRRFATYTGFALGLLGTLLASGAAIMSSFELFVFASLLFGASTAFIQQLRFAAIESVSDSKDVPTVLSILMLSGIFSAFLGPEIAVAAKDWLTSPHGYAGSFLFLAGLFIVAMVLMIKFTNPEAQSAEIKAAARPLSEIIKQPIFIISILSAAIGFALMSYLMTATPLSMHHLHGHSLHDTKWVIQSHIAAMFIPSLFTALLVKHIGLKNLMLVGTFIYALVTVVALSGQHVMHYWWALVLLGVGWNFLFLTGTSLLPQSYQASERHKVQAINDFIIFGFQATASLMAGWVLFKAGWHVVVLTSLPFILVLFIVSWFYFKHERLKIFTETSTKNANTLTILQRGDPVLSAIAKPVSKIHSKEIKQLIDDLKATVIKAKGVGIAAPQVGESVRLFIMCSAPSERYPNAPILAPSVIINPEIVNASNEQELGWEGCLSVEGKRAMVSRHVSIDVRYFDEHNIEHHKTLSDFLARIFQHELDHLDGITFIERLPNKNEVIDEQQWRDGYQGT